MVKDKRNFKRENRKIGATLLAYAAMFLAVRIGIGYLGTDTMLVALYGGIFSMLWFKKK